MHSVSAKDFLLWKENQLKKGGDKQSLDFLIDGLGGVSINKLNTIKIRTETNIKIKVKLDFLESIWEEHLRTFKPIQYLVGFSYWRDLKLTVSDKVLIPRSESELIIEIISEKFKNIDKKITFVDLGTGSGALSIALALANPNWEGIAIDIDQDAIKLASENFAKFSNHPNLKFYCGNWWHPLVNLKLKVDLAVSNPPYIPRKVYENLPIEVKNFEPKIALLGGEDGLENIKKIIEHAPLFLKEKGFLLIENHFDQGSRVKKLFSENGFNSVHLLKDLSGIGRFTIGRYK